VSAVTSTRRDGFLGGVLGAWPSTDRAGCASVLNLPLKRLCARMFPLAGCSRAALEMRLIDSSVLKTALQVSPFCFPSGSPGPSVPECSMELREQLEDLQETEISFVSTPLFRRKRGAPEVGGGLQGLGGPWLCWARGR